MANSFRKQILDILFEPEEGPEINKIEEKPEVKIPNNLNAQDLLYGKKEKTVENKEVQKEKTSTFIDYTKNEKTGDEKVIVETKKEQPSYVFEPQPNISPIFGDLDAGKTKKKKKVAKLDYVQVDKPANDYLGIVPSPIYGYDTQKANASHEEFFTENIAEDEVLDEDDETILADSEIDLFADYYKD